jgi:hypothetical protein
MQQLTILGALSLSRQVQRLERDIQSELVPELEAIDDGARGTVDFQGHSTNAMRLEPFVKSLRIEAIYRDGHRQLDAVIAASRYGKVNGGWDLRRYAMIRKCADQAYGRVRRECRDDGEVGVLGFVGFGRR